MQQWAGFLRPASDIEELMSALEPPWLVEPSLWNGRDGSRRFAHS
jgi:hypothetical protein